MYSGPLLCSRFLRVTEKTPSRQLANRVHAAAVACFLLSLYATLLAVVSTSSRNTTLGGVEA